MGGGIKMGNTCKSMADSFQCMTKPTTIKKKEKREKKKTKIELLYVPAVPLLGIFPEKIIIKKKRHMQPSVCCSTIYNTLDMEATGSNLFIDR